MNKILNEPIAYAVRLKNREELQKSSSGGAFTAFSDVILDNGGAVICCRYNYNEHITEYILVENKEERNQARGSKYMQSILGDIFKLCMNWLKNNPSQKLLFVGMGCQVAGFIKYIEIQGLKDRIYTIDIICHGSPSPMIWKEYIKNLEKNNSGKIKYLTFKDKRNGWSSPTALVNINEEEVIIKEYVDIFYSKCALRPSCHVCPYANVKRKSDITIGDFWGIDKAMPEFYNELGNSLVLIHNENGLKMFKSAKKYLEYKKSNTKECLQPNLIAPTTASEKRQMFWHDYEKRGINFVIKKYGGYGWKNVIKRFMGKVIRKIRRV